MLARSRPGPWRSVNTLVRGLALCAGLVTGVARAATAWHPGDAAEVLWGEKWYPASVLEVKADTFKIHYEGYGSNWDEWVTSARLRPVAKKTAGSVASHWKAGDRVDAWNVAWYPAEVLAIGDGEHAGQVRVHYENFSAASDQWLAERNLRTRAGPSAEPARTGAVATPRLGKYGIYSFGTPPNRMYLGDVILLAGGHYRVLRPGGGVNGEGTYAFDPAKHTITWLTGPYQQEGAGGAFEISREGRTHTITLHRGTVASSSVE